MEFGVKLADLTEARVRHILENAYDEAVDYVTADSEPASAEFLKYNRIKKLYDMFMKEYTALLDVEEILK